MQTVHSFWYPHTREDVKRPTLTHFKQHNRIWRVYKNSPVGRYESEWEVESAVDDVMRPLGRMIKAVCSEKVFKRANMEDVKEALL